MAENNTKAFVLDTSALLAYIEDEDGADYMEEVLIKAERNEISAYIAFVSLTATKRLESSKHSGVIALFNQHLLPNTVNRIKGKVREPLLFSVIGH